MKISNPLGLPDIISQVYPVGSIYMSVNNVSPATLFGGTWERIQDKFLLSAGSTYTAGATGGSATNTLAVANLPAHNHTFTGTAASHTHTFTGTAVTSGNQSANHTHTGTTSSAGGHTHNMYRQYASTGNNATTSTTSEYANAGTQSGFMVTAGAHTHTMTTGNQSASHTHSVTAKGTNSSTSITPKGTISNTGSGTAVNNMPPYLAVYMWKRTA